MTPSRPLYTSSALKLAQRVFLLSSAEPTNLYLWGEDFGDDLPRGRLLLRPLRDLLLRPETSAGTRDAVWAELVRRSRSDGSSWTVAALGMAMPGLLRQLRVITSRYRGDRDDLESALAEGFVAELRRVDADATALSARLLRAAYRAGVAHAYREASFLGVPGAPIESRAPQAPWGHPDFVLAHAVRAGVLSAAEAQLIAVTRLEGVAVQQVAAACGEPANTVVVRRRRAELRLREAIAQGRVGGRGAFVAGDRL